MKQQAEVLNQGRCLYLRRTRPDDAALLWRKVYNNAEFSRLFRLNEQAENQEQVRARLIKQHKLHPAQSGYLEAFIVHRQYGPIGLVCFAGYAPLHRRAELLVGLFEANHRAHYGVEAGLLALGLGFNFFQLNKLCAYVYEYNTFAQQVLGSAGFKREGLLESHVYSVAEQRFVNLCIYGMTVDAFRANPRLSRLGRRLVGRDVTLSLSEQRQPKE